MPAWWRHGGSTYRGVPARRAGTMPSCTSASNGTVSAYHAGDTLRKRSYGTVPACRAVSKLQGSCTVIVQYAVSNLDSSSTTMTNLSQHSVPGPCRYLLHDMSSTWRQGAAITWPAWRGSTMPVRHAGTKNFHGMLDYLGSNRENPQLPSVIQKNQLLHFDPQFFYFWILYSDSQSTTSKVSEYRIFIRNIGSAILNIPILTSNSISIWMKI